MATLSMVSAYFIPLWQILMWAPQYPEGLSMKIWINNLTGDIRIISALNHYIGMRHIEVSMFPEFGYMLYIVGGVIAVGIVTVVMNRRYMLALFSTLIVACGVAALTDFYLWGYDYGHNLDPKAPIIVPGMSYQPPLIGTKKLLNFTAFSGPDIGGWIFIVAGAVALLTLAFEIFSSRTEKRTLSTVFVVALGFLLFSCSVKPRPLAYGKDACYTCKMTLMDTRFGAEIVTTKGKIYTFDDANCLIQFCNGGEVTSENLKEILIVDFSHPEKLIDGHTAFYVKSDAIKSPMASSIAAFGSNDDLEKMNTDWNGTALNWGELQTQYNQ